MKIMKINMKIIKGLNDNLDEIIDKSKSFEDQTDLHTCQMKLTKIYLNKYLVIHL